MMEPSRHTSKVCNSRPPERPAERVTRFGRNGEDDVICREESFPFFDLASMMGNDGGYDFGASISSLPNPEIPRDLIMSTESVSDEQTIVPQVSSLEIGNTPYRAPDRSSSTQRVRKFDGTVSRRATISSSCPATEALEKSLIDEESIRIKKRARKMHRQPSFTFGFLETVEVEDALSSQICTMMSATKAQLEAVPPPSPKKKGLKRTERFF